MTVFELTTHPGLEDLAWAEVRERLASAGWEAELLPAPLRGRVRFRVAAGEEVAEDVLARLRTLRSAHHLLRPLLELELPTEDPLGALDRALREVTIPGLDPSTPFRITAQRSGSHPFTSQDLARVAGAAVQARSGAPVDLESFAVEVRVDVKDRLALVAVQLTRTPLTHRYAGLDRPRVALKADIAYALLRLLGRPRPGARLLDPFCGSGTILLEAGALWRRVELWGLDRDPRAARSARSNLCRLGLGARARILCADALAARRHLPERSFARIATNPPYGRRLGRELHFFRFYRDWLAQADALLEPEGRIGILVRKRDAFRAAVEDQGVFRIRHVRVIDASGLFVGLFILSRDRERRQPLP